MHIFIVYKEWIVNWYYVCLFKLTGTTSLCFFENIFHSLCSCEQTVFPSHYILANISYCQTLKSFPTWCTKMLRHCIFILHFWLPVKMDCFSICLLAILMSSYWNISIFSLIFYLKKLGFESSSSLCSIGTFFFKDQLSTFSKRPLLAILCEMAFSTYSLSHHSMAFIILPQFVNKQNIVEKLGFRHTVYQLFIKCMCSKWLYHSLWRL